MIYFKLNNRKYQITLQHAMFYFIVTFYWILMYILPARETLSRFSFLYFLTIIPIYLYIIVNLILIIKSKWFKDGVALIIFFILTSIISIFRFDLVTIVKLSSISLLILIVIKAKLRLSIDFLNTLFIISIFLGAISYFIGTNVFGFLPGMAKTNLHQGLGWRVSMFNSVPNSSFFSLLIFIINIFDKRKFSLIRKIILLLSIYFIILSGSRTSILIFLIIVMFKFITLLVPFKSGRRYLLLSFTFFSFALGIFYFNNLTLALYKLDSPFINSLFFKSVKKIKSQEDLDKINYRTWLWEKHIEIYKQNPIFGKGNYNIRDYLLKEEQSDKTNYSESFLTDLLVKVGIIIIPFLAFFYYSIIRSIQIQDPIMFSIIITLLILMISYGSFFVPYNFIFLTFIGSLSINRNSKL